MENHLKKMPSPLLSLVPILVLVALLFVTIRTFGSDALSGGSQVVLLTTTAVASLLDMNIAAAIEMCIRDRNYIIGEMIGELGVGHAYVNPGEVESPKRVSMGLLGAEVSRDKSGDVYKRQRRCTGNSGCTLYLCA